MTGREVTFSDPKTAAGRRKVLLVPEATAALKVHQLRQDLEKTDLGGSWGDQNLVFTTRSGGRSTRGTSCVTSVSPVGRPGCR